MPIFKSATYTLKETAAARAGSLISDAAQVSGKLHFIQSRLVVPAGTANADIILLDFFPAGMVVIPGLCTITGAAAGAPTVGIGFAGAPTAIAAAVSLNTAGSKNINSLVGFVKNDVRRPVQLTLSGALTQDVELFFNFVCVKGE